MRELQGHVVLLRPQVAGDVGATASEVDAVQAGVQLDAITPALEAVAVNGLWSTRTYLTYRLLFSIKINPDK